jgi:hypothetical protein
VHGLLIKLYQIYLPVLPRFKLQIFYRQIRYTHDPSLQLYSPAKMPRNGLPIPASAMQRIPEIRDANRALIAAFESHPSYASQSTSRSGKVYFMWDFATRTDAMFEAILNNDAPTASMSEKQREESKSDSVGRCMM